MKIEPTTRGWFNTNRWNRIRYSVWGSWKAFWRVFVTGEQERGAGRGEEAAEGEKAACLRLGAGCQRLPEFNYFTLFTPISGD